MKKFKLVYLIRLREKRVQQAQRITDLFYHEDPKLSVNVVSEVLQCEGRGVLFVLDGFDELPISLRRNSLFVRLIQGSCLPHCTVLVTSRPSATADLLSVATPQINKQIELLGFTRKHIEEYAKSVFSSQVDNMLADFLKYISVNPAIRSMMYIPLNSAIVVEVYRANKTTGSPIPQTMTQLYSELSNVLLKRHLMAIDPLAKDFPDIGRISPQNKLYKSLCTLAKLAFEGIERQEVIFDKLPEGCDHFGFMNASSELYFGKNVSYSFLHLTLQGFLAAFHISQLPADKQKQLFEEDELKELDTVWRFVAGLTGFNRIEGAWNVVRGTVNSNPFYIQCLYEAQEKVDLSCVFPKSNIFICVRDDEMKLFDYYALGYCVSASRSMWELEMRCFESGGEVFEMLSCGLQSRGGEKIDFLDIYTEQRTEKNNLSFFKGLATFMLKLIRLNIFSLRINEVDGYQINSSCSLINVLNGLSNLRYLHTLKLVSDGSPILRRIVKAVSELIQVSETLRKLTFGRVMSFACLQLLAEVVFTPSSLNEVKIELILDEFDLSSSMTNPFARLQGNHNVQQLTYCICQNDNELKPIPYVAKALHNNTTLKILSLERVNLMNSMLRNNDLIRTSIIAIMCLQVFGCVFQSTR